MSIVQYKIPTLETKRLILREFRLSDFDTYAGLMANPQFKRYLGKGELLSRELSWRAYTAMIGHWVLRGFGFWALERKDTGEYIGHVGIHHPEDWPGTEIGWGLDPKQQGQGFALEAAKEAMRYGFDELKLERLISLIVEGNQPSVNLAKALGEKHNRTIDMMDLVVNVFQIEKDEYYSQVGNH